MSWVRVAWFKCTLLYVSYMLVQISFFISSTYIVFVFIDPKISTPMNQGRVPHNNLSFHRCIPPSYHNFIKWRPSTLDPVPRPGRPRNFVTMGEMCREISESPQSFNSLTGWNRSWIICSSLLSSLQSFFGPALLFIETSKVTLLGKSHISAKHRLVKVLGTDSDSWNRYYEIETKGLGLHHWVKQSVPKS